MDISVLPLREKCPHDRAMLKALIKDCWQFSGHFLA
jgi:hypothetical protein